MNDIVFSAYFQYIVEAISSTERVPHDLIDEYRMQVKFQVDIHNVYIWARRDPEETWILSHFQITKEDIETIMQDWKFEWKQDIWPEELSELDMDTPLVIRDTKKTAQTMEEPTDVEILETSKTKRKMTKKKTTKKKMTEKALTIETLVEEKPTEEGIVREATKQ